MDCDCLKVDIKFYVRNKREKINNKTMSKSKKSNVPNYPKKHDDDMRGKNGATSLPANIFCKDVVEDVFGNKLDENHKWEQFFWTKDVVDRLAKALEYTFIEKTCCLATPSLAHKWHISDRDEVLLDIDKRFEYLPKFRFYDMTSPDALDSEFRIIVIDPPFFAIPIEQVREAVDVITNGDFSTKILIAFLKRAEKRLRIAFEPYNLVPTKFELQYASIKSNKWKNFVLYSNIDLPGIKRKKENF